MINKEKLNTLLEGCEVLKNKHFYKEVFSELIKIKTNKLFNNLEDKIKQKIISLLAQCKYQDKELPSKTRFKEALVFLDELDEKDCETLCLKGAVYKRKYELHKKVKDLYKAINFYESASNNTQEDKGYGAVNAIYLYYHLIASLEDLDTKKIHLKKIKNIRKNALVFLCSEDFEEEDKKWIYPTIAELFFSINRDKYFEKAKKYLAYKIIDNDEEKLKKAKDLEFLEENTKNAILKSEKIKKYVSRDKLITLEQLINLYKLRNKNINQEKKEFLLNIFENFLDIENTKEITSNIIDSKLFGKFGLALSGGGFRAGLFHIGVLARLAQLDILKHIEVISTVSGGSIVGMQYYIMLKKLLETKVNSQITQDDYIDLVKKLEEIFLEACTKNIRMKAFKDFKVFKENVTNKLGDLYQEEIYDKSYNWIGEEKSIPKKMNELYIYPKNEDEVYKNSFNPHFNNIEIKNKVPILVINASVLNNGHNWRFTANGMGESQYMYDTTIDKNSIHKYSPYYKFDKDEFKNITIANAVASSSAVPGLIDPLVLKEIYQDGEILKLVDGGLYDNQGLANIIYEECNVVLCSDASGQFRDENNPSSCRTSVFLRNIDALMDRTRDLQYESLNKLYEDKIIEALFIIHLKQCFSSKEYEIRQNKQKNTYSKKEKIIYDKNELSKKIQEKLSKVRTDLDSFNQIEAYSLIYSGYTLSSKWLEHIKDKQKIFSNFEEKEDFGFRFFKIKKILLEDKEKLEKNLDISRDRSRPFKNLCQVTNSNKCYTSK